MNGEWMKADDLLHTLLMINNLEKILFLLIINKINIFETEISGAAFEANNTSMHQYGRVK